MIKTMPTSRPFLINSRPLGEQRGASLKAYCGLFEGNIIAGYGRWRDTVTPYAYAINDFLALIEGTTPGPNTRFCVMPNNGAVSTYVTKHAPIWEARGVNGHSEVPQARDEWIRIGRDFAAGKFVIYPDYKVFRAERQKIETLLDEIQSLAESRSLKDDELVRVDGHDLMVSTDD
ncbi:hypothetical protein [Neorhizobium sp. T25_13]|uniref:hypothetical protein n=1 Tax=Neorhizobium sp. T25_13 TaxID=2093830 RepID=UPI00155E52A9|nr:hypothetical protein [Neorhizobium sp. T25_13]